MLQLPIQLLWSAEIHRFEVGSKTYFPVPLLFLLLEEPRGLGPAEDYTNLHKNIESKGCIELLPPEIFYVSSPKILLKVTF